MQRVLILTIVTLSCFCVSVAMAATPAEIEEWLQAHNKHRILHGVAPFTWSATVAASAQAYADTCPFNHSGSGYGENLAWASYDQGRTGAVDAWYNEEPLYDYDNPGFSSETGHFTQVVWKGTLQVGCGYKSGCAGGWPNVWVCQYDPPGNYISQFGDNVFPPNNTDSSDLTDSSEPSTAEGIMVPQLHLLLSDQL